MNGLRRISTWISLPALTLCISIGPAAGRPLEFVNQFPCSPAMDSASSPFDAVVCQADAGNAQTPAVDEQRQQYIRKVLAKSKVAGKRLDRTASGFFVSADGLFITTANAVHGCAAVTVSPMYGEIALGKVIAHEERTGFALLQTDIASPGTAILVSSEAFNRNPVYMLGYPVLGSITSEPALTAVRVLNSQKTGFDVRAMLIDGDVQPGYNGGPVLDSGGGVIGLVVPGKTQSYKTTDAPVDSMGLAIPSEALPAFLERSGVDYRAGLQLPPKPPERLLIDSRPFVAQVGCWQ